MSQTGENKIQITKVAYGGKGIGLYKDKVTFVPGTIDGDTVAVEIIKEHKNFCEAKATNFIKKSPHRIDSPCQYSKECGGCQWIDVRNEKQIQYKREFIEDSFARIAKEPLTVPVTFFDSPKDFNYRNRILLRGTYENGKISIGFFAEDSHTQVPVENCQISHSALNDLISYLNKQKLANKRKQKFRIEAQVLPDSFANKEAHLLLILFPIERNHELEPLHKALKDYSGTKHLCYRHETKKAPIVFFEEHESIKFYTKPGVFQQINTEANHELRKTIKKHVLEKKLNKVLDLYCGSGNLSLGLHKDVKKILGVEGNDQSIAVAQKNLEANQIKNAKYLAEDASKFLKKNLQSLKEYDCLIIDPPRRGAKEDIATVLKIAPQYIFYISCNPTTAARDYSLLKEKYKIVEMKAFNFFPQTYHIESFFVLEKKV